MHQKILLDQHFKNILRSKLVLAYIMKDNLDEYANSSIGEIMKCIEPKGDVPLHTHLISGHRNELLKMTSASFSIRSSMHPCPMMTKEK